MTDHTPEFLAQYPKYYGAQWQGRSPDFTRCAGSVPDGGRSVTSHQCSRANGHGPHGAWCKTHDPVARKAKREATYAKWRAESANSARNRDFAAASQEAVRQIAAGHNDPRGLCQAILNKLEAGE